MFEPIIFIDAILSGWAGNITRVALWAVFTGTCSTWIYARTAPQNKIVSLKKEQQESRELLLGCDGEWDELKPLIKRNIGASLHLIAITIPPVLLATAPVIWVMFGLYDVYDQTILFDRGPDWVRGFDAWFIVVFLMTYMMLRFIFKIA